MNGKKISTVATVRTPTSFEVSSMDKTITLSSSIVLFLLIVFDQYRLVFYKIGAIFDGGRVHDLGI
ncbi:hypothetical protein BCR42DRAFT_404484 [Absidia repens]|uniref:Transmembrane protein n=1 Tax=Absidia repens TaxID=90262 RepID=A0A1X2IWA6_9FUNG|nr:hypothetical protein BCR42DRAFT_404484 [Absidia repens]